MSDKKEETKITTNKGMLMTDYIKLYLQNLFEGLFFP